jgi:hypothetical protein
MMDSQVVQSIEELNHRDHREERNQVRMSRDFIQLCVLCDLCGEILQFQSWIRVSILESIMSLSFLILYTGEGNGFDDRLKMDIDRVRDILGIAAGHRHGDGQTRLPALVEDHPIALGKAALGDP